MLVWLTDLTVLVIEDLLSDFFCVCVSEQNDSAELFLKELFSV